MAQKISGVRMQLDESGKVAALVTVHCPLPGCEGKVNLGRLSLGYYQSYPNTGYIRKEDPLKDFDGRWPLPVGVCPKCGTVVGMIEEVLPEIFEVHNNFLASDNGVYYARVNLPRRTHS